MATSISKFIHDHPDNTHDAYQVTFFEHTVSTLVTHAPANVDTWIAQTEHIVRHTPVIGLDIEWRPNFQNPTVQNPVATLQLCVGCRCLVFQTIYSPYIPHSLKNLLGNPNYTFTGVGIKNDVQKLKEDYNIVVAKVADVRAFSQLMVSYVLGQLQNKSASDALSSVLKDVNEHPMVRHEAAEALGSIADDQCISLLEEFSKDPEPIVSQSCEVALSMLDFERSSKSLEYLFMQAPQLQEAT